MTQASTRLAAFLLATTVAGCASESETTVVKLGHALEASHPVHRAMVFMGERLEQKSNGRVRIDIYPSQQLGTERELIELLQIGSLGMTKVSSAVLESFVPVFRVYGIPYLFADQAHRERVLTSEVGKALLRSTERARVLGLVYYDSGARSFYTKPRPIHSPDDLAGLKIRTQESPSAVRMVQALGGSATPLGWNELYTALQQGIVDGAENNPPSFYLSRHYEICRYYVLNEHTTVPDVLLVSTTVWHGLSPDEQRWLQESADESFEYQARLWQEATEEALRALAAAGVEIVEPDRAPFAARVQSLHEEFRRDPELGPLMERIRRAGPDQGGQMIARVRAVVDRALASVLVVIMSMMVVNVVWQVFTRFVLARPSSSTEEFARYLLIWLTLLGGAYAAGQRLHLAIDLFTARLGGAPRRRAERFIEATVFLFALAAMVVGGARLVYLAVPMSGL
jgi:tripartite ATP-independent transporter DctP family solute receptor